MTPISVETVLGGMAILLMGLMTFMVYGFSGRLKSHEARTNKALQLIAEIRATQIANSERTERIEDKLDAHLATHRHDLHGSS